MKVGDLVTLSARGCKLVYLQSWTDAAKNNKLVGLVERTETTRWSMGEIYYVRWIGGAGPKKGRDEWSKHFARSDLKMVSRAK
jgi:hypothetical protein